MSGRVRNWFDTAGLITALDLIVSVDTAVCHLAAAMGEPMWLLNRFETDRRWLLGRDDNPRYPSLRIFREPAPGAGRSVVTDAADAPTAWRPCDEGERARRLRLDTGRVYRR